MVQNHFLQGGGILSLVGGCLLIWYAFQRQMCNMGVGEAANCGPNVVYFVPGILATVLGISLFAASYRRNRPEKSMNVET